MPTDNPFHEAIETLRATGRHVELTGDDLGLWLVDDVEMTDGDLIALALRLGLMTGPERLQ
ncbi:hypothetical protein [uncultured Methylobacterium sp.]|uniref:hypothetical protein n=1 Tax=uncultured Methylobacterium sp. TaxID=157278 RepID=UPI0035CC66FE